MCRVWLSNDRANQSAMMEYAQEYLHHNISVSEAIVITQYFNAAGIVWQFNNYF